ncbi:MAG: right-handed parallel beta-helix repeat-containing protein, partial [Candidatus Thorarchaeota archaeon]
MKRERDDFQEKESNNTRICIERRRLILVTLSAVLLLSYFSLGMNTQTQPITVDTDISPARLFSQAETHGPISIDGDVDFNDTAFVEGWTGNGSESNPFVIEDYEIDLDRAVGNCIEIVNTRVHFIIENCTLDGATTGRGVYLSNTTNGIIKEILSLENRYGIEVVWSEGIVITNNNCSYPMEFGYEGIRVAGNGSCVVANNTVVLHSPGIEIAGSSYTTVFNNSVTRAEETCISVIGGSAYTELLNNTCFNSETGIESRTHNVIIANNIMDDLNLRGVFIAGVHNNTIVDNMFTYCYMYGVTLVGDTFNATVERNIMENVNVGVEVREAWGSTPRNNTISWNSFKIPYTIEDAADNTTIDYNFYNLYHGQDMNQDGVGDTPYDATGWGDFIDYHPLILPLGSNPSWIHAPSNQVLMVTESFYQDVNATAYYPGVDSWWVNDTTFFS